MKKEQYFIFMLSIFILNGCISLPQRQSSYQYSTVEMYRIDSIIQSNIIEKGGEFIAIQRYITPKIDHNFYYIVKKETEINIIRFCNHGIYGYNLNKIESYSYLANHLNAFLYDTLLQSEQKFSHDPYISISGKINDKKFQHTISYRQIVYCSTTSEYILLLERDLLNILERQTSYLFQYPIANESIREKKIIVFLEECLSWSRPPFLGK